MNRKSKQWTSQEVLRGKTLPFIILSIFFTYIMNISANKLLSYFLNIGNTSIMTYHYSFGILGILFVIPAALMSIFIIKKVLKIKGVAAPYLNDQSESHKIARKQDQEKQFKWYNIYGIVIGYFFLWFLSNLNDNTVLRYLDSTNMLEKNPFLHVIIVLVSTIVCFIIAIIGVKFLNKIMIEKTQTNKELLNDIREGIYDSDFSNNQKKNQTIKLLKTGNLSSVKTALYYLKIQRWLLTIGKFATAVAGILFVITMGAFNLFGSQMSSYSGSYSSSGGGSFSGEDSGLKKEVKKNTRFNANQKQKEADYARHQAGKQAAYNSNTYHMKEKYNYAKQKQHEANEADRNARNL